MKLEVFFGNISFIVLLMQKTGFYSSFTVEHPQNCTAYELQVRCACETSLASDWSASRRIPGLEMGESSLVIENILENVDSC